MVSSKLIVVALVISCLVCITVGQQYGKPISCREGEKWYRCLPCSKTCKNVLQARPLPICNTQLCAGGCDCEPQYVRNDEGKCVYPSECDFNN